jgi:hypothetical protein
MWIDVDPNGVMLPVSGSADNVFAPGPANFHSMQTCHAITSPLCKVRSTERVDGQLLSR